jgi:hypothetical protein
VRRRDLEGQPSPQPFLERIEICPGYLPDHFEHKPLFHGGDLGFDSTRHIQAGGALAREWEVSVCKLG